MKKLFAFLLLFVVFTGCTPKTESGKKVVYSFLDSNIANMDPINSTNRPTSTIAGSVFEGLYHYHYLKRPLTVEPALAASMPNISPNGQTYTIEIKKGVHFQDDPAFKNGKGRELVAGDVIYAWKRLADPANKAYGWWLLDDLIVGLNKWRDDMRDGKANYDTPVEGLNALDTHKLEVKLTRQSYQFVHIMATTPLVITAREVVEKYGKEIGNHPVGTGPFLMKKWVRNSKVELEKNPNYRKDFYPVEGAADSKARGHLKYAGQRLPLADKVIIRIFTERQPEWLSFLSGEIDHGVIPKENNGQVFENRVLRPEMAKKGISILNLQRPDVTFLGFNMEHPILGKNKNLRKAMISAIDRKSIHESFYSGRGTLAQGPIPPGIDSYDPDYRHPLTYDLEKAKEYMKQAGFPDGKGLPVFEYDLPNTAPFMRQFGELLKDMWSKIGVKVRLKANTWPQFDKKVKSKKVTLFDQAWFADYPDSENFLQMFYSKNISPGSNNFNYNSPEFDKLFKESLKLPNSPKRTKLNHQMVRIINEDAPVMYMIHRHFRLPYHSWLDNYNEHPVIFDHLRYYYVDPEKKKEQIKNL